MKRLFSVPLIPLILITFCLCLFVSCGIRGGVSVNWPGDPPPNYSKPSPPPHAKAHGYRAKYHYRYYPSSYVYFDTGRGIYFYLDGDQWHVSVSLPQSIFLSLGDHVWIEMDTDRPYTAFKEHKKQHPPQQAKKSKVKKWK